MHSKTASRSLRDLAYPLFSQCQRATSLKPTVALLGGDPGIRGAAAPAAAEALPGSECCAYPARGYTGQVFNCTVSS